MTERAGGGRGCVEAIRRNQKQQKVGANPPLASRRANQPAGQTEIVLLSIKTFEDASVNF